MLLWILPAFRCLRVRGSHAVPPAFPGLFCWHRPCFPQSEPHSARTVVWALPRSLAATCGITFVFSSSGYLDVSVHRVPSHALWIHAWVPAVTGGFPHSDIPGSMLICSSPRLFAAYHVFLRLSVPRHPPCAFLCLTFIRTGLTLLQCKTACSLHPYSFEYRRPPAWLIYSVISSSLEDFFSYLVNQLQVIDLSSLTQNQLGLFRCLLALYSVFKVHGSYVYTSEVISS